MSMYEEAYLVSHADRVLIFRVSVVLPIGYFFFFAISSADHDDRVCPLHSYKYIAELQHTIGARPGEKPLLIRIDRNSGHGGGKPTAKVKELVKPLPFETVMLTLQDAFSPKPGNRSPVYSCTLWSAM